MIQSLPILPIMSRSPPLATATPLEFMPDLLERPDRTPSPAHSLSKASPGNSRTMAAVG
jgi:hypothetical protein